MNAGKPGLVVLYRWRLHPGMEADFIDAWSFITQRLLERGSFGSRLHRGPEDTWYGYAQWPNEAARQAAFGESLETDAVRRMRAAIAQGFPEVCLEPVADFLILPPSDGYGKGSVDDECA
jgi:hypothetical protein